MSQADHLSLILLPAYALAIAVDISVVPALCAVTILSLVFSALPPRKQSVTIIVFNDTIQLLESPLRLRYACDHVSHIEIAQFGTAIYFSPWFSCLPPYKFLWISDSAKYFVAKQRDYDLKIADCLPSTTAVHIRSRQRGEKGK